MRSFVLPTCRGLALFLLVMLWNISTHRSALSEDPGAATDPQSNNLKPRDGGAAIAPNGWTADEIVQRMKANDAQFDRIKIVYKMWYGPTHGDSRNQKPKISFSGVVPADQSPEKSTSNSSEKSETIDSDPLDSE